MYSLVYNTIMNNKIQTRGRPREFDEIEVLTAAMHYFWEHGYDNTYIDDLVAAMGIKKSSFYATFKSKEEIFIRTLEFYRKHIESTLVDMKNKIGPRETLISLAKFSVQELQETGKVRGCLLANSASECYGAHVDLSHKVAIEFNEMRALFASFIMEAQEKGEISTNKSQEKLTGRYLNSLNGLVVTIQSNAEQETINDIIESIEEILE
ncbi:MAG TPA: TetR/AcrR family transcriptional regulator [Epsilonproteobacteria bacterium]|nr:TetR/AcrR family transcriptional regulator [Campylobacterota bacterium]